eukprot:TRINITY_DN51238_c0_g1_i1.p1 TRINITY_DN51238_c0_g1~~TRINITY_DN51238_c0_g1_i1.p1  ORF type:complete len:464 (+),score=46.31 TRINITY_DN51238_c0_g1_i1:66-1457(+)
MASVKQKRKLSVAFPELPEDSDSKSITWRNGLYSDWCVVLGTQRFSVHKLTLASGDRRSLLMVAMFRQHLGGQPSETDLSESLPESSWPFFEMLLDYMYTGCLQLKPANWGPMVKFADVLQIPDLHALCMERYEEGDVLQVETAVGLSKSVCQAELPDNIHTQVLEHIAETLAPRFITGNCDAGANPWQVLVEGIRQNDHDSPLFRWFTKLLAEVLKQESLEICTEDDVLAVVFEVLPQVNPDSAEVLKQAVRLGELSHAKLLELAGMDVFSKQDLVLAGMQRCLIMAPSGLWPKDVEMPVFRGASTLEFPIGSFRFLVRDPLTFDRGQVLKSGWKNLPGGFKCCLLVRPQGGDTSLRFAPRPGATAQLGSSLQLAGPEGSKLWMVAGLEFSISLVGCQGQKKTKTFVDSQYTFRQTQNTAGWNAGLLTCSEMAPEHGWIHKGNILVFEVAIDASRAKGFPTT